MVILRVMYRWLSSALQWCVLGKAGGFSVNGANAVVSSQHERDSRVSRRCE